MAGVKAVLRSFIVALALGIIIYATITWYPYIFSKEVTGEITGVERVMDSQMAVISGSRDINRQIFSFAVGIKEFKTGEIFTASTEDRQWAIVQKGQCATVLFFPYPPWKLDKDGTYFNARLVKLFECANKPAVPAQPSTPPPAQPEAQQPSQPQAPQQPAETPAK